MMWAFNEEFISLQLLNSIANDLDYMLNDLCVIAPPAEGSEETGFVNGDLRGDSFKIRDQLFEDYVGGVADDADESNDSGEEGAGEQADESSSGMNSYESTLSGQLEMLGLEGGGQGLALPLDAPCLIDSSEEVFSSDVSSPCEISILERLIRTHPIWFLPEIGRAGAVHILRDKIIGSFIVRQSSVPNTMALSVRLPEGMGPDVEHYLVEEKTEGLRLEGSEYTFAAIPMLVSHYCDHCDELPVKLVLPFAIMQAISRQELSSMALLGQDFWTSHLNRLSRAPPPVPSATHSPFLSKIDCLEKKKSEVVSLSNKDVKIPPPPPPHAIPLNENCILSSNDKNRNLDKDSKTVQNNASFTVTTTVTFNVNQSSSETKADEPVRDKPTLPCLTNSIIEPDTRVVKEKKDKDGKRIPYYKQSSVLDSLNTYYKGSLADKLSDYEDIWNASPQKELLHIGKISKEEQVKLRPSSRAIGKTPSSLEKSVNQIVKEWDHGKIPCQIRSSDCKRDDIPPRVPRKIDPKIFIFENIDINEDTVDCIKSITNENENEFRKSVLSSQEIFKSSKSTNEAIHVRDKNVRNEAKKKSLHLHLVEEESSKEDNSKKFSSPQYSEPFDSLLNQSRPCVKPVHVAMRKASLEINKVNCSDTNTVKPFVKPVEPVTNMSLSSSVSGHSRELEAIPSCDASVKDNSSDTFNLKGNLPKSNVLQKLGSKFNRTGSLREKNVKEKEKLEIIHPTDLKLRPVIIESEETIRKIKKNISRTGPDVEDSWPVDTSWEWLANETESDSNSSGDEQLEKSSSFTKEKPVQPLKLSTYSETSTMEDIITRFKPQLRTKNVSSQAGSNRCTPPNLSEYDNLGAVSRVTNSSVGTVFSEPWDSTRWDYLLRLAQSSDTQINEWKENNLNSAIDELARNGWNQNAPMLEDKIDHRKVNTPAITIDSCDDDSLSVVTRDDLLMDDSSSVYGPPLIERRDSNVTRSFQEHITNLLAPPRLIALRKKDKDPGNRIRDYIFRLVKDRNTTFGNAIENFIQCTKDGQETNPHVVLRNIRQFMSGIKNYLVKHGEGQLEDLIERERSKLLANEFLNIDAILEGALHKIVIKPLKPHIYQCFANEYTRNGSLKLVADNIRYAKSRTAEEIGIKPEFTPPHGASLEVIRHFLAKLQKAYSPLKKLESLLAATSSIYNSTLEKNETGREAVSLGADDFLPMFIYVLIHCGMISAEIEADYMWGLLHPSLLVGEGGYYLTTLSSAVHVLKNFQSGHQVKAHANTKETCIGDLEGFMKLIIPDEQNGSIISKTIPVRPNMTTKEVGKMIAHKFKITNPQDYGLFQLIEGQEFRLNDLDCPQSIKCETQATGKEVTFAFKRNDAKIAWPMSRK